MLNVVSASIAYFVHAYAGFAFVYMKDDRDAEDAIRALDRYAGNPILMQMLVNAGAVCLMEMFLQARVWLQASQAQG